MVTEAKVPLSSDSRIAKVADFAAVRHELATYGVIVEESHIRT